MKPGPLFASNKSILVVDDTPANLSLLAQMLSKRGYDVRVTRSAKLALRSIEFTRPDLILLDILMPEMDGYEVCAKLKADERTRDIPIIFISALDAPVDKVKAFKVGGVDYITKPFEVVEVLARVDTHMQLQAQKVMLQLEIEERQRAEMESSLLLMSLQAITRSQDLRSAIAALLYLLGQMLQCDFAEAWTLGEDRSTLEWVSDAYFKGDRTFLDTPARKKIFPLATGLLSTIWSSGQPQWLEDFAQRPALETLTLDTLPIKAILGVPVLDENRAFALLVFYNQQPLATSQKHFMELVSTVANQLSAFVQRQRAEAAQRLAEQKYQSIFENSLEGIFQSSPEGHYLSANPALAQIYGYDSPEELLEEVADIATQVYVDPQQYQQFTAAMKTQEGVSGFESLAYRRDGTRIWIAETGRAVQDETGKILYYEGTVTDITERKRMQNALQSQKAQSERLLLSILPQPIAKRLQDGQSPIADYFEDASILFADLVGFTEFSSRTTPVELVEILGVIFSEFDQLAEKLRLEKIKTIGDNYMVVGGLPLPRSDHAAAIAQMALDMQTSLAQYNRETGQGFQLRIGINLGSVVAGVMGRSKMIYDLWGDTVNVASRMESTSKTGKIQVTASVYERLKHQFRFEERGEVSVKGKGNMQTYWLLGR